MGGNRGISASLERGTAYAACLMHDPTDSRSTELLLILLVIWDNFSKLLPVTRRSFIRSGLAVGLATPVVAALRRERLDEAVEALARATREGQVAAAVLHVVQRETSFTRVAENTSNGPQKSRTSTFSNRTIPTRFRSM